jgi:hypothetical protein
MCAGTIRIHQANMSFRGLEDLTSEGYVADQGAGLR